MFDYATKAPVAGAPAVHGSARPAPGWHRRAGPDDRTLRGCLNHRPGSMRACAPEPLDRREDGARAREPAGLRDECCGEDAGKNSGTLPSSFRIRTQRTRERAMPAAATPTEL
jgi:hypothetical protein